MPPAYLQSPTVIPTPHRGAATMACTGKSPFATQRQAARVAERMMRKSETTAVPYRCPHCGAWHIAGRSALGWNVKRKVGDAPLIRAESLGA